MEYTLNLPDRPFNAIRNGTKKVEGRITTPNDPTQYSIIKVGDTIKFHNEKTNETIIVTVLFIHHYKNVEDMLITEGVENVLSSEPKTIEHGIESYNNLTNYKENIKNNGIYAIGLKPL